jgi:hypothetical protein
MESAALTVHITKLQAQLQQAKLETELNSARQKLIEIENSYSDPSEKHKTAITAPCT